MITSNKIIYISFGHTELINEKRGSKEAVYTASYIGGFQPPARDSWDGTATLPYVDSQRAAETASMRMQTTTITRAAFTAWRSEGSWWRSGRRRRGPWCGCPPARPAGSPPAAGSPAGCCSPRPWAASCTCCAPWSLACSAKARGKWKRGDFFIFSC